MQHCYYSTLSCLACGVDIFLNKSLADSVRISGILQKIRHVSVSLCCREPQNHRSIPPNLNQTAGDFGS